MKKLIIFLFLVSLILLVGCGPKMKGEVLTPTPEKNKTIEKVKETPKVEEKKVVVKNETKPVEVKPAPLPVKCTHNSNCTAKKMCVEGTCKLIADLYKTENCTKKCNFNQIKILTSDGETYTYSRGKGSYTAASALEWQILSGPDYCQGEKVMVPFKILKRNYGKVFADEVITVNLGQTSKVIKHPLQPDIAFTLKVESVKESCS